jgi:hypothetical protein
LPPRPAPWLTWIIGHAGRVQRGGDLDHLLDADLLALGMHAVAQAHVVQQDLAALEARVRARRRSSSSCSVLPSGSGGSCSASRSAATGFRVIVPARISSANISAVRQAAAVMMSRLPA